jgi:hypothetical protein
VVELFGIVGALGAGLSLLARRRPTLLAGLATLVVGEIGIAAAAAGSSTPRLSAALVAAAIVGIGFICAFAFLLVRRPELVTPLLLVAAPFRLPLDFGRSHRYYVAVAHSGELGRLLPLYVVLAAAIAALAWRTLFGETTVPLPPFVAAPAAAFVAFSALSLLWSKDLASGRQLLEFFLLPLATLVAVVGRARFAPWLPRALAAIAIALASVFAALALWQQATHKLLFYAPTLQVANAYAPYFRVTSLFRDPSLYGRQVVLGLVILVVLLWRRRIPTVPALLLIALLWAGLLFSYSQSSFAALFVAVLAVSVAAADRRSKRIVAAGAAAIVLAGAVATAATAVHHSSRSVTSDRSRRITLTAHVWEHHPAVGVGLGGQPTASQALADRRNALPRFVSHTTPLTILAELGIVGFAIYVLFVVGTARLLLAVYRRDAGLGLVLAGVLLALFVHSLAYSGFFEDPITWFTIGVAAAAVTAPLPGEREGSPTPIPAPAPVGAA